MAQNISSLLQMAQQQYDNQGTAAATQADTAGSPSMDVLKGMMARGGAAQKLAQQRNLENQKGLERLFAEAGVGSQGLLNTLGIGLGNALGQRSAGKNPDGEMQRANAIDNLTGQAASSNDPNQLLEFGRQLIALGEYKAGGDMIALSNQYRNIEKAAEAKRQDEIDAKKSTGIDTKYDIDNNPIPTFYKDGEQFAVINGVDTPVGDLEQPLFNTPPKTTASKAPTPPSAAAIKQVRAVLNNSEAEFGNDEQQVAYASRVASKVKRELKILEALNIKNKTDNQYPDVSFIVKSIYEDDLANGIIRRDGTWYGFGKDTLTFSGAIDKEE